MRVAIVGGGPVGLFLACCLQKSGISCTVFEKRPQPVSHSRSIGIHPVSLELFENVGLVNDFLAEGIKVREGHVFCHEKPVGTLSFESCPPPYRFILLLPQHKTELLLANRLQSFNPDILQRNTNVVDLKTGNQKVQLKITHNDQTKWVEADYVVGCDGKNSYVRKQTGISFSGKDYDDTYIMGDFSDNTSLGDAAAIFLCRQGVIESFPFSGKMRRWVVKTREYVPEVTRQDVEKRVQTRIGYKLGESGNTMLSSFGVEKKFAGMMAKGRILLAGDAAHIISPIGGQGMNLGWLDAWDASLCLLECLSNEDKIDSIVKNYSNRRLRIAGKAAQRAEFNMAVGRETKNLFSRKWLLRGILKTPASKLMANLFTMRGLCRYLF